MIAHIVLFEPKGDASPERRDAFVAAFEQTVRAIPEVQRARIGRVASLFIGDSTRMNRGQSTYSFGAVLEFADEAGLQRYLTHPAHDVFRVQFWELCHQTLIADVQLDELQGAKPS